jgi:phage-related minor tail protein
MGEAGPEGILPLRRGPDGKLGVIASGGGDMSISFSIDARGAGPGVGQEIAQAMTQFVKSSTFESGVIKTVRDAKSRRAV